MTRTEDKTGEEEIEKLATHMLGAWNRNDIESYDSAFSEDADFVDVAGRLFHGRDQIAAEHSRELEGQLKGTQLELEQMTVRFLRDGIAVVHIDTSSRPGNRRVAMTLVIAKENGAWRISAGQGTIKA